MPAKYPNDLVYCVRYDCPHLTNKQVREHVKELWGIKISESWVEKVRLGKRGGVTRKGAHGKFKDYSVLKGEELRTYFIVHARNLINVYTSAASHSPYRRSIQPLHTPRNHDAPLDAPHLVGERQLHGVTRISH